MFLPVSHVATAAAVVFVSSFVLRHAAALSLLSLPVLVVVARLSRQPFYYRK